MDAGQAAASAFLAFLTADSGRPSTMPALKRSVGGATIAPQCEARA